MSHPPGHVEEDDILCGCVRGRLDDLALCRSCETGKNGYTQRGSRCPGEEITAVDFIEFVDGVFHGNG